MTVNGPMPINEIIRLIRWEYFTNNKSGLIFKELMKEFEMVNKMTENKRYIVKGSDDFFLHIEDTTLTEDKHEGTIDNIYQVVDRLNEQEEKIQELKQRNQRQYKRLKQIREEQIETILKQKRKIKELEEETGRMKGAFKRKFDYDIEEVVDEICDEDW